jgi:hypothetical protein
MKSCLQCIYWEACKDWSNNRFPQSKNPFPLCVEDNSEIDICGLYKSRSEYELEIVKKFAEKLKEKRRTEFPCTNSVYVEDIDGFIKEMENKKYDVFK